MAGFSGTSGVPKSYVDDLVAQSTAKTQTPLCAWGSYALNDVITLSESIDNFDYIVIRGGWDHPNGGIIAVIMPTFLIPNNNMHINVATSYGSTIIRKVVQITSRTSMTIVASTNDNDNVLVRQIWGVKLGS